MHRKEFGRGILMINAHVYDYINVLDKAADAAWLRNDAIANNISNATTPGYKRQDVAFESELKKALQSAKYSGTRNSRNTLDKLVANVDYKKLDARPYEDNPGFSYRLDGNNVDPDAEGVYLAENQLRYQGLMQSINDEFSNLKMVMQ